MNTRAYRAHWPQDLQDDIIANEYRGVVGTTLVSETEDVRVWHVHLPANSRSPFHRHVLNYFWTCHSHGQLRIYCEDGSIKDTKYYPGSTHHYTFARREYRLHSIENIGDDALLFTTVKFKKNSNPPLPIPDFVRLKPAT